MPSKISVPLEPPQELSMDEARNWYRERNFVPSPVVIVTTVDEQGTPNAAVKTNVMTVSSMKRYAFCCHPDHHTYQNVMAVGQFVINIPTAAVADKILRLAKVTEERARRGTDEIAAVGLSSMPSEKVRPPRIAECVAHYECLLDWQREGLIVGRVISVSVDPSMLGGFPRGLMVVGIGATDSYGLVTEKKAWRHR